MSTLLRLRAVSGDVLRVLPLERLEAAQLATPGFGNAVKEELQDELLGAMSSFQSLVDPVEVVILPIGNGSEEKLLEASERGAPWGGQHPSGRGVRGLREMVMGFGRSVLGLTGDTKLVEQLLAEPADPNCLDSAKRSPLSKAWRSGASATGELPGPCEGGEVAAEGVPGPTTPQAQANVELRDGNGNTPLITAAAHGKAEVAKSLLSAGAKKDETDQATTTTGRRQRQGDDKANPLVQFSPGLQRARQQPGRPGLRAHRAASAAWAAVYWPTVARAQFLGTYIFRHGQSALILAASAGQMEAQRGDCGAGRGNLGEWCWLMVTLVVGWLPV
eukprot:Skav221763  [mRNA]  locus=scaffold490:239501:249236:+ [translate_table: standard]